MSSQAAEVRKKAPVFTVEQCLSCGVKKKRPFVIGDHVFKEGGECEQCHGKTRINAIFAETLKPA